MSTSGEGQRANLSPREQALLAAEQRAKALPQTSTPSQAHQAAVPFNPSRQDILTFSRIMDSQLLPNCTKAQAVETLETIQTLLSNILSPPNPSAASKYRQIRLSNARIQRVLMNVANGAAHDYLVASGFRRQTIEFTAYLVFPPSPTANELHRLKTGHHVLGNTLKRAQEADEREKRYRESEKEAEKARKDKALLEFEEDRRLRSERDEREKIVREARAAQPSPPVVPRATTPPPNRRGGSGARTSANPPRMRLHQSRSRGIVMSEEVDDDGATPPPSYGELHGRVLGTGLPPDAVDVGTRAQMVHDQDLEFSDREGEEEEEEDL